MAEPARDEITRHTIMELIAASEVASLLTLSEQELLAAHLVDTAVAAVAAAEPELYAALVNAITGEASEAVLAEAATMAHREAVTLVTNMTKAQLNAIGETVAEGLAQGKGPREIARMLTMVQDLDGPRAAQLLKFEAELVKQGLSQEEVAKRVATEQARLFKERRETTARTEARFATEHGAYLDAVDDGARWDVWITAGDDRVSDECEANEAAGPIPIDDEFPGGVHLPPQHPNCRCTVAYTKHEEARKIFAKDAEARAEKTSAAKAAAEEKAA